MAQLAANRPVPNTLQQRLDLAGGVAVDLVMTASSTIYEGALVGYVPGTGTIHALVDGDAFAGIALKKVVSDATAGSTKCPVYISGFFQHAVTSLTVAGVGAVAFATSGSSDNTIDITSSTLPAIGRVVSFVSTGIGVIQMKAFGTRAVNETTVTTPLLTATEN
jgi:hypothetical protein